MAFGLSQLRLTRHPLKWLTFTLNLVSGLSAIWWQFPKNTERTGRRKEIPGELHDLIWHKLAWHMSLLRPACGLQGHCPIGNPVALYFNAGPRLPIILLAKAPVMT